jgi:hypothetical protein
LPFTKKGNDLIPQLFLFQCSGALKKPQ